MRFQRPKGATEVSTKTHPNTFLAELPLGEPRHNIWFFFVSRVRNEPGGCWEGPWSPSGLAWVLGWHPVPGLILNTVWLFNRQVRGLNIEIRGSNNIGMEVQHRYSSPGTSNIAPSWVVLVIGRASGGAGGRLGPLFGGQRGAKRSSGGTFKHAWESFGAQGRPNGVQRL